ncbi:MAG: hypothetical protein DME00_37140 [Candidatus Rokuibacteriota bacterium]|nr:MAG: hypothetical protein DME00_37140 [Candidatus Rokubacteria bacterium]
MRPQGSPAELEQRRLRAIELLQRDLPVHVVAGRLGVARRSVRRWKRAHRRQGRAGLRARPASGRPPKLSLAQRHRLARLVMAGPEAAGYRTGLWTCRRIVVRSHALAREGFQHRRLDRVASSPTTHPGVGPAPATPHSGPPGGALSSPSRAPRPRSIHPGLGSGTLSQARARAELAACSSLAATSSGFHPTHRTSTPWNCSGAT